MADYTLHFIDASFKQIWGRHEGVGGIENFKFIDIHEDALTKVEIVNYMNGLNSLDNSIFNIPVKILNRYLHHLSQLQNLIFRTRNYTYN